MASTLTVDNIVGATTAGNVNIVVQCSSAINGIIIQQIYLLVILVLLMLLVQ